MSDEESFEDGDIEEDLGYYEGKRNEEGERHGEGKAHLPNGDHYEGEYVRGKRQGKGLYKFQNGARYNGEYFDGKKHGIGTMIYPDGSKYEGWWSNNAKQGEGIYYYVNGDTYDGFWVDDQRHGVGTYNMDATNTSVTGKWENGQMHGRVKISYPGYEYYGRYTDGLLQGKGKFTFKSDGIEQIGQYIIKEIVESKTDSADDDKEYFVTTAKESVWKSEGIRPINQMTDKDMENERKGTISAHAYGKKENTVETKAQK